MNRRIDLPFPIRARQNPLQGLANPRNGLGMKRNAPLDPVRVFFRQAFGPGDWLTKAQQVLGVSRDHIHKLCKGRKALTLRHRRLIEIYTQQRRRARKAVVQREYDKIARVYAEAAKGWAAAELSVRAQIAELSRQGRK